MPTRQKEPKERAYYVVGNRLTSVNGVTYTWDNNGNLLNDGVNSYGYDGANRLITMNGGPSAFSYGYNGLGDRLQQTVNGQSTRYALDINTSLPDALSDGSRTYTYGLGNLYALRHASCSFPPFRSKTTTATL